jgi:phosphoglycolate phosphatase
MAGTGGGDAAGGETVFSAAHRAPAPPRRVAGLIFDKDGTLFDFGATWSAWTEALVAELARLPGASSAAVLAGSIGFDSAARRFAPDSPVIAHTPAEIAARMVPHLPGQTVAGVVDRMNVLAAKARTVEAVPLAALFSGFRAKGLKVGLATNDAEMPARAHLAGAGIEDLFDFVAGWDSGYGAKPAPGPLLAFAARAGLAPASVAMVGDSRHDLVAGRAAGMVTVGVLTGIAGYDELAPFADAVLPDIGHLPTWLDRAPM